MLPALQKSPSTVMRASAMEVEGSFATAAGLGDQNDDCPTLVPGFLAAWPSCCLAIVTLLPISNLIASAAIVITKRSSIIGIWSSCSLMIQCN